MKQRLLPFFDERRARVEMIVLHATAFEAKKALQIYEKERVSCHYFIESSGEIWRVVREDKRAWHAGVGRWREFDDDINSRSIGIELASSTLGQQEFMPRQKESLIRLLKDILQRYDMRQVNIVGHSDIAPCRKADPGKDFFWKELAEKGIGLWPNLADAAKLSSNDPEKLLKTIGYDTADVKAAAYAFCRRFLPEKIMPVDDIEALIADPGLADDALLQDDGFLQVLKATAYKYLRESNTPCKI